MEVGRHGNAIISLINSAFEGLGEAPTEMFKSVIKKLVYWVIPAGIEEILRRVISKILMPGEIKREIKTNKGLRDLHMGERCFILATGPSIKQQDLSILKDELCISVGYFYLHKNFSQINPKYHVDAPTHKPHTFKEVGALFDAYEKYFKHETKVFLGYNRYEFSYFNFLKKKRQKSNYHIKHIDYSSGIQINEQNFQSSGIWDLSKTPFSCRTVVYSAIQIAAYMGVKEIYLLGCDHDYLLRHFKGDFKDNHFYTDVEATVDASHAEAQVSLETWFEEYYFRWRQYRLIKEYLNQCGCRIYNATEGGILDVFPRVALSKVLRNLKNKSITAEE
jgi:hypothetical protein